MAVDAQSVKDHARSANRVPPAVASALGHWPAPEIRRAAPPGGGTDGEAGGWADVTLVDLRAGSGAIGGGLVYEGERLATGFHWHDVHQIEYAEHGVVEVDTPDGTHLLPPHQAAWIPAGCVHQATLHASVRTISVLFDPGLVPTAGDRVRILAASPLIREMVLHAARWPISRPSDDPAAEHFFRTLAHLVGEALDDETPLRLPTSRDPVAAAAIDHTQRHLTTVTARELCAAIGVSERTLRRRFADELGMPWRTYLVQARLMRARALLPDLEHSVLEVALAVGFENVSAFTRAFVRHTGETPSAYRRRVTG
jgi:AraC-like DNA-binding protein